MNIREIINEIFDVLLKIVRSNKEMESYLDDEYKLALIEYMKMIPDDKQKDLFKFFEVLKIILSCVDFNRLFTYINQQNIPSININSRMIVCNLLMNKFNFDKKEKKFVDKLLQNLENIFYVIDYIFKNPKEIVENANIFASINDDIFN